MRKLLVLIQHYFFQLQEKFIDSYTDSLANELTNLEESQDDDLLDIDMVTDDDVTWVYLGEDTGNVGLPKLSLAGIEFYVHGDDELGHACALMCEGMDAPVIMIHMDLFSNVTERELIGVLLHESGHIVYGDVQWRMNNDLEDASLMKKILGLVVNHYQEWRADGVAKRFGYGPDLALALDKLQGQEFVYGDPTLVSLLLGSDTHPSTLSRVARLRR